MQEMTSTQHADVLRRNFQDIRARIAAAAAACQRDAQEIELLAVSKGQPTASIRTLYALGQRTFGENYAQELARKAEACQDLAIHWQYIGALQSNKIDKLVAVAGTIQTLASLKHAALIAKAARAHGKSPYPVYIAVNVAPELEPQKNGIALEAVDAFVRELSAWQNDLAIMGIMAVPPPLETGSAAAVPPLYAKYTALKAVAQRVGAGKLSLGMSQDLEAAVKAGSDCVRIGSALLGSRQ